MYQVCRIQEIKRKKKGIEEKEQEDKGEKMERAGTDEGVMMLCVKLTILGNYERGSYRKTELGKRKKENGKKKRLMAGEGEEM